MRASRRVPLGVVLPVALVAFAALLWSAGWLFAARQAERLLTDWQADQAARGRSFACARETRGGYPFRLELSCERPQVTDSRAGAGRALLLTARAARAVAQVYDLEHIILEVEGPIAFADAAGTAQARVDTAWVRASIELAGGAVDRLAVVLPPTRAEIAGDAGPTTVALAQCQLHTRRRPGDNVLDIALSGHTMEFAGPLDGRLETIEVDSFDLIANIERPVQGSLLEPVELLRRWRAGGGVAEVSRLSFRSPSLGADAKGSLAIAADGTVEGALDAALTRLDAFVAKLKERGAITENEAAISAGAAQFFGKSSKDGEAKVTLPVRVRAGEVFIGPIRATRLPRLIPDDGSG